MYGNPADGGILTGISPNLISTYVLLNVTVCCRTNTDDNGTARGASSPAGAIPAHVHRFARVEVLETLWVDFCRELSVTLTGEARLWPGCCLDRCFSKENSPSPLSNWDARTSPGISGRPS